MQTYIIPILICLLAWWGLWDITYRIVSNYKSYPDVKTEISFDIYERPDWSWYIKYWNSAIEACKLLLK